MGALRPEAERLLAWFRGARRELPWRRDRDPWRVWVSEVMLQQTRVETAIPYFERFLERFPGPGALAAASEQEVLQLWQGLGYYGRARALRQAALEVVRYHRGRIPEDPAAFGSLPGVGPYTAAAVQSLAFGRDLPAVDGNVARVLSRWHALESPTRRELERISASLMPPGRGAEWNEALMELGATICTPRRPRCESCPLGPWCARRTDLPVPRRRGPLPVQERTAVVAADERGRWCLVQRPPRGLLAGLWEFPQLPALTAADLRAVGVFTHTFTHRVWRVTAYRGRAVRGPEGARWLPPDRLRELPVTALAARIAQWCQKQPPLPDRQGQPPFAPPLAGP